MIRDYLSEQELRKAAATVRYAMLEALPDGAEVEFSEPFHQKMEALMSVQKGQEKQHCLRRRMIAAIAAFFVAVTMLLTFHPEVQAAVIVWFKEVFDTHTVYHFHAEKPEGLPAFELTYVPEGCEIVLDEATSNSRAVCYENPEEFRMGFTLACGFLQTDSPLIVDYCGTEVMASEVQINGCPGTLYLSSDPAEFHALVWIDEAHGVVFSITSYLGSEVMLRIAEGVKPTE